MTSPLARGRSDRAGCDSNEAHNAERPQSFPCTSCGAASGTPCVTAWGRRAHYSHEARKREAALPRCAACTSKLRPSDIRLCHPCRQEMNDA